MGGKIPILESVTPKLRGSWVAYQIATIPADEMNYDYIREVIAQGVVWPGKDEDYEAVMAYAGQNGHVCLLEDLVKSALDIDQADLRGNFYTAMTWFANTGNTEGIREASRLGASVAPKVSIECGAETPLEAAVTRYHDGAVELLLALKAPHVTERPPLRYDILCTAMELECFNEASRASKLKIVSHIFDADRDPEEMLSVTDKFTGKVQHRDCLQIAKDSKHDSLTFLVSARIDAKHNFRKHMEKGFPASNSIEAPEGLTIKPTTIKLKF